MFFPSRGTKNSFLTVFSNQGHSLELKRERALAKQIEKKCGLNFT